MSLPKTIKTTYQYKKTLSNESVIKTVNSTPQSLADLAFDPVDPLSVLSSYYQNHQIAEPIDSITNMQQNFPQIDEKKEIKDAKNYIQKNIHRTITLNETAKKVFLSPYYFSKLFKAETGITFIAYINQQKMIQASDLLRQSDLTIKEIAKGLGFTQMSYFSRTFKKEFGITPKDYRSSHSI